METNIQGKVKEIPRGNLTPIKGIGQGGFAYICSARDTAWQKTVAVKQLHIWNRSPEKAKKELCSEAQKMASIRDEHVLDIYGICVEADPVQPFFALVLPYMENGSVSRFLDEAAQFLPWALRLRMLYEVASGMVSLHEYNILHLDLKAANVLLTEDLHVKIADFGLSRWHNISASSRSDQSGSIQGTLSHIPPENLRDPNKKPTTRFDVYSYAILMWEILTGKKTYEHCRDGEQLICSVKDGCRPDRCHLPTDLPDEFTCIQEVVIPLMEKCWSQGCEHRGEMIDVVATLEPIYLPHKRSAQEEVPKVLKQMEMPLVAHIPTVNRENLQNMDRSIVPFERKFEQDANEEVIELLKDLKLRMCQNQRVLSDQMYTQGKVLCQHMSQHSEASALNTENQTAQLSQLMASGAKDLLEQISSGHMCMSVITGDLSDKITKETEGASRQNQMQFWNMKDQMTQQGLEHNIVLGQEMCKFKQELKQELLNTGEKQFLELKKHIGEVLAAGGGRVEVEGRDKHESKPSCSSTRADSTCRSDSDEGCDDEM